MNFAWKIARVGSLLEDKRAIRSLITWPKFSLTSFLMVARLGKQGIAARMVIDAGANVGQFAVAAAKLFPNVTVHSFEPNPASAARLRKNVSSLRNVKVYPLALGDTNGQIELHVNRCSHSSSLLHLTQAHKAAYPDEHEQAAVTVQLATLDSALADMELLPPVLVKMDVEGYEAKVIWGARQTLQRANDVVIETCFEPLHEGQPTFRDILQLMEANGFCFTRPIDSVANPRTGEIIMMDALFVRRSTLPTG